MPRFHLLLAAIPALLLAAGSAEAADRKIYSYDAVSPQARNLTGAGLTFTFKKGLMRTRVQEIRATGVPVGVKVRPLSDGGLEKSIDAALGEDAGRGTLYEIDTSELQGPVMIKAFCPGSTKAWLAVGAIAHGRDLKVHAFGDNPSTGAPRLCATMDFAWHGEWKLPNLRRADPLNPIFQPDYGRPGV